MSEKVTVLHEVTGLQDLPNKFTEHPAIQMLNTVSAVDGELVDALQSDSDVRQWLAQAGWPVEKELSSLKPASLLHAARTLREAIRTLIERRKAEKRLELSTLNEFLSESRSHLELVPEKTGLHLVRRWKQRTAEEVLAPLAEVAAEFLTTANFELVRRCENEECVLWFYDQTKSHRRRWCSMATCGNRHKVAAFRRRRQNAE
jgi:predicted RNA-binding Zn ribbon-like protein